MDVHKYNKQLKELKKLIKKNNNRLYWEEKNPFKNKKLIERLEREQRKALKEVEAINKALAEAMKEQGVI